MFHFKERPQSLCHTCRRSTIVKGGDLQERVYCHAMEGYGGPKKIQIVVEECSSHTPHNELHLHDLEKIAWLIELKKNTIGFHAPKSDKHKEFRERHQNRDYVDPMADD